MTVTRNPIQKHCFNLLLLESHGIKNPQTCKTSENLWISRHWSEINSLLTASLGWGFLSPKLEACSSGAFQPNHSWLLFLRYEETQVPPPCTMTPPSLQWLLKMFLLAGLDGSLHCSHPELKNTNSTHFWGVFFGNKKHLERKFWLKIDWNLIHLKC